MNITLFACGKNVFTNCECIKGHAFKMADLRDNFVLFYPKTAKSVSLWGNYVHFDLGSLSPVGRF